MKKQFLFSPNRLLIKGLFLGLISFFLMGLGSITAQVNFPQASNAVFNYGVLNNTSVSGNSVYLQNAANSVGNWLTTTVLPQTLSGHKTISWNDRYVYSVGGFNGTNYVNSVYVAPIYGGGIGNWTTLNPLPVALRDAAVVIGVNTIYVLGGRDATQAYNTIYYASLNGDGSIGAWQTSAVSLPGSLWGHTASYMMGYIYVMGGSSSMTETSALSNVYYTKVNAFNALTPFNVGTNLPEARNRHSIVTYNNKLYIIGGYNNSGIKANTVYIATPALNGSNGSWTTGANLPVAISNHSSVVSNGLITIMAGCVDTTLSNTVYYANADAGTLSWSTAVNEMYDITKDGSAFAGNGQVCYTGGTNLSNSSIFNCRYAYLNMTSNFVNHGSFVSYPFYELGAERLINSLSFNAGYTSPANLAISYRMAGSDGIWGDWTVATSATPININQTKQYVQYSAILTGSSSQNSILYSMTLTTPGTPLSGNLNSIPVFTKALSPYWATSDISFTGGTHVFEAGATILFMPATSFYIGQANVICNGTAADSVKFTYYTNETGKWYGLYFGDESDAGVSSQFNYTIISNAGYGSWNANLNCNNTNEPMLSHCSLLNADGYGIILNNSHINIQNSLIKGNAVNGIYLNSSSPTINSSIISYNAGAGIYYSSNSSVPTFGTVGSTKIEHNTYAMYYPSPNFNITQPGGSPVFTANTYNGIAFESGELTSNIRWSKIQYDYILLGNIRIWNNNRLTIEPGATIKTVSGAQIQIGHDNGWGGELYAIGTVDSLITFTSFNGLAGGWEGIYFKDQSDAQGEQSQMDYCVIEKGNSWNVYSVNTSQPNLMNHTIIRNALVSGAGFYNSSASFINCQFLNNGKYPIVLDPNANPIQHSNLYVGNVINRIALTGGWYSASKTLKKDSIPYIVLDNLIVGQWGSNPQLTIEAGVTLEFEAGKKLQVGYPASYGGGLRAQGSASQPIVFKAFNNTVGGWEGIYFYPVNDDWGGTSVLEYCTITQGNSYNIYNESSNQPYLIRNCTISNSAGSGLVFYQATGTVQNNVFLNNNAYPLVYNDWTCNISLSGNTYIGNTHNYISLSGGWYTESRRLYNDGIPYHVQSDIVLGVWGGNPTLYVDKGVTLAFNPATKISLGTAACCYGGSIWAEGSADSIITFKPYNNAIGGWGGINFNTFNDDYGGNSTLKYCVVEKAAGNNLYCSTTSQPTIDHCVFDNATSNGITLSQSTISMQNSTISNSASDGIIVSQAGGSIQACQFLNNNGYPLIFNDFGSNVYLRANRYIANTTNFIGLTGGDSYSDKTLYYDSIPYHVFSDIRMLNWGGNPTLVIKPGVTLEFDPATKISLGTSACCYGGALWAEGKADSIITFRPFNNLAGGWGGLNFYNYNDDYGATSILKYCVVEKAVNSNVYCENSYQPTIDHTILRQSTGNGLTIYNGSLSIRNSDFTNNTTNGIYVDGGGSASIGNSALYTCNLYSNGAYAVYNNSTADVYAANNFWGASDSVMIAYEIFDKTDNQAKGTVWYSPFVQLPALSTSTTLMSGNLQYANLAASPMKNALMLIKTLSDSVVATTTSNASGYYAFTSFPSGIYKMDITPSEPWGGVNSTDALMVLNHFVQHTLMSGLNLSAADANRSHTVNGTDALFLMKRYSSLMTSFPSGDYLYNTDTFSVTGNQVINNIKMLCYGDVNASYTFSSKSAASVGLLHEGSMIAESFTEYDFPIRLKTAMQIGAASLGFYYPKEYLDIVGVKLGNGISGFSWSAIDGLFKMGWCDVNALNISDDEVMLILRIKTKNIAGLSSGIDLNIYEESELADAFAVANDLAVVSIPTINTLQTSMQTLNGQSGLRVYPNPVKGNSAIMFTLDNAANIQLSLVDVLGKQIREITEGDFVAGSHKINLTSADLNAGIYFLKFSKTSKGASSSETIKFVISN